LGDLYDAQGQHEQARTQYETLGRAPSAYFKARSAMLVGQSYQHEGKHEQAVAEFAKASQEARGDSSAKEILLTANLANSVSEAALGKVDLAVARLGELIVASARDELRLAQAYNALGDCYRQAGDPVAARLAYLHVDLLLPDAEQERAHALHELAELWQASGDNARATQTRQRLTTEYPHSRWAAE
jgi:tetratricopeptide (TPR) repeat protein